MSLKQNDIYNENLIENLEEKKLVSLNQISTWLRVMKTNQDHFGIYDIEDFDEAFEICKKMTEKQYNYLKLLLGKRDYFKIKNILDNIGFKHKKIC
jgi:hypothetical protein